MPVARILRFARTRRWAIAVATDAVDRPVARGRDDPGTGVARAPVAWPALERRRERILDGVLGQLEVADRPCEDADGTAPLLPEDLFDPRLHGLLDHPQPT